ncbi:sulfatase-like hydrolase/transferase [Sunxiuqinia sp. A32]|uniref:sulfatase-like hydrolase/transferase n=1 Tax=Sunxiuqinia sp. A32 TaxID=3461496 RepID=UPI00404539F6
MPNIVIILADDVGYGDIGGYYRGPAKTPNLDGLAQEGMLFTDFHSNGPTCSPTRASLLTGRYPQRLGVEIPQKHVLDLPQNTNEITMAQYLKRAGYCTAIVGKWHLGQPREGNPIKFGFDEFWGYFNGDLDYFSKISRHGSKDWWHNEDMLNENGYVTDLITNHSCRFIEDHKNDPFFLYVSQLAIHFPWQEPADDDLWTRREGDEYVSNIPGPFCKLGPHTPKDVPSVLINMIEKLDESVGCIVNTVKINSLSDNTLIFFLSDNGGYTSYADNTWQAVGSNGILKGQKTELYEGGHRVPAIAWCPGKIPASSVCDETVLTFDLLPTFLELLDISVPQSSKNSIDGVSLLNVLFSNGKLPTRTIFWRTPSQRAVRMGNLKLVMNDQVNEPELYDLRKDIGEKENIASQFPQKILQLNSKIEKWEKDLKKENISKFEK